MADVKISDLPDATRPLAGTELFEAVQGGANVKVAASDLVADPTNPSTASAWVDDFIFISNETGEVGNGWSFTNGSCVGVTTAVSGHPGVMRRTSTATANAVASLYTGSAVTIPASVIGDTDTMTWIVSPVTGGADFIVRLGHGSDASSVSSVTGYYFERLAADTNWFAAVSGGGVTTRADTGVAFTAGAWYKLTLRRVASADHRFSVNGGTEIAITNPNVPAATQSVMPFLQVIPTTNAARSVDVDFASAKYRAISR